MTEISRPWNGTVTGDAGPYSDQQWHEAWRNAFGFGASRINYGPVRGNDDGTNECLFVRADSPATANVIVSAGSALVRGIHYLSDADETLAIAANASGNDRIDVVVLRADFTAQTVRLAVRQGTPAASPIAPALTQTDGVLWEIPIADVYVANGFTGINQSDITPNAHFSNLADGVYLDNVLNNSGATLETGDVVILDTSTDRAVTTTTTENDALTVGVWVGRTDDGDSGRVQVRGIGYIRVDAAVGARNTALIASNTAGSAMAINVGYGRCREIARSLETTAGAGLCLAYINVRWVDNNPIFRATASQSFSNTNVATTLFGSGQGTLTLPANALEVGKMLRISIMGYFSTDAAAGTVTLVASLGGTSVATSGARTLTNSLTTRVFRLDILITCRTVGATGTVFGQGKFHFDAANSGGGTSGEYGLLATAAATINTTGTLALDVTWAFGTADADNAVVVTNSLVELLPIAA